MMKIKYVIIAFFTLVFIMISATCVVAQDATALKSEVRRIKSLTPVKTANVQKVNVQQSRITTVTSTASETTVNLQKANVQQSGIATATSISSAGIVSNLN